MKLTKVVITGYIEYDRETVVQMDLSGLCYQMDEGSGICVDIECKELDVQTQNELPKGTEDFFEVDE